MKFQGINVIGTAFQNHYTDNNEQAWITMTHNMIFELVERVNENDRGHTRLNSFSTGIHIYQFR